MTPARIHGQMWWMSTTGDQPRAPDLGPPPPASAPLAWGAAPFVYHAERTRPEPNAAGRPRLKLAVPVDDLSAAREFYGDVLGLDEGRSGSRWADWDLHGHQLVTYLAGDWAARPPARVVGEGPAAVVPQFGMVLDVPAFHDLAGRLRARDAAFVVAPFRRLAGGPGDQWATVVLDPAGNAIELRAFRGGA